MADIFLSYKREDREKVRPLVTALEDSGRSVWWDTRIGVGEKWDRVIETQLAAAKCVLVVWSKLSVESDWVRNEAHEGQERGCLIPVVIEDVKPPIGFRLIQTTNLTRWKGDRSDALFSHICEGVERLVAGRKRKFGNCCVILKDVLGSDEFAPLIAADDKGILYMSIGVVDVEKADEANMVDHPVFFCPFCGTKLQSPEEVDAAQAKQ